MSAGSGGRHGLGWHRLTPRWAERVVRAAGVRPGDRVLDLGAGTGALTRPLVRLGAAVLAVEVHPRRADRLAARFRDDDVVVAVADLATFRFPGRPFRVVANPPFGGGNRLVRRLTGRGSALVAADLVLQRGLVYGLLADLSQGPMARRFTVRPGLYLPRSAFAPMPRVDALVLQIRRR